MNATKSEWCLYFSKSEYLNFLIHLKFISCSSFLHLWWQTLKIKTFETENGLGIRKFNFKTERNYSLTNTRKGWINPSTWLGWKVEFCFVYWVSILDLVTLLLEVEKFKVFILKWLNKQGHIIAEVWHISTVYMVNGAQNKLIKLCQKLLSF